MVRDGNGILFLKLECETLLRMTDVVALHKRDLTCTESAVLHIASTARNRLVYPNSNSFRIVLDSPLRDVYGFELLHVLMPKTEQAIDFRNNIARFRIPAGTGEWTEIEIQPGEWTLTTLLGEMNLWLTANGHNIFTSRLSTFQASAQAECPTASFEIDADPSTKKRSIWPTLGFYKPNPSTGSWIWSSTFDSDASLHKLLFPGIVNLSGAPYVRLKIKELDSLHTAHGITDQFNIQAGLVRVTNYGDNDQIFNFQKVGKQTFHPIARLSTLTFEVQHANGSLYNLYTSDFTVMVVFHMLKTLVDVNEDGIPDVRHMSRAAWTDNLIASRMASQHMRWKSPKWRLDNAIQVDSSMSTSDRSKATHEDSHETGIYDISRGFAMLYGKE